MLLAYTHHFPGASSSLSLIVITETAGEGVSCIVMVCCRTVVTCWCSTLWLLLCLLLWWWDCTGCSCQWLPDGECRLMLLGGVLSLTRFFTGLNCCASFLCSCLCWGCCTDGTVTWCWWCLVTVRLPQLCEGCSTSALALYTSVTGNTGRWSFPKTREIS